MARHRCFRQLDRALSKKNTRLMCNLLDPNEVFVGTERIKRLRNGKKAVLVVCSHCPFCGEKLNGEAK